MSNVTVSTASQQTVVTPHDFIDRVCQVWPCNFDLAATKENKRFIGCFTPEDNALAKDWSSVHPYNGNYLWLNPPFSDVRQCAPGCQKEKCIKRGWHQEYSVKGLPTWMEKCAKESQKGARIVALTLSSRGTDWYHKFVKPYAQSLILRSRLQFEDHPTVYPKELMVNVFANGITGEGYWDWKIVK